MSSLSSLLLAVMVARESTPVEVGAWAIAYAAYTFVLSVSRAAISTAALIADSDDASDDIDRGVSTLVLLIGATLGLVLVVFGVISSGVLGIHLVILGVGLPVLLFQDSARYVMIRNRRPDQAAMIDSVWLALQLALGLLAVYCALGGAGVMVAWLAGAVASAAFGAVLTKFRPNVNSAARFIRSNSGSSGRLLVDSLLNSGAANLTPVLIGVLVGLAATGYFRGALTLLGVAGVFIMGLTPIATVELKSRIRSSRYRTAFLLGWSATIGLLGLAICAVLVWVPDSVGESLIGESWGGTREIIAVMSLQLIFRGPVTGVFIYLRAARDLNAVLFLRAFHSLTTITATLVGAYFFGLVGAAWAWAFSSVAGSLYAVGFYIVRSRRQVTHPLGVAE